MFFLCLCYIASGTLYAKKLKFILKKLVFSVCITLKSHPALKRALSVEIKMLPINPDFSNWVSFITERSNISCSGNEKRFKIRKLKFFLKISFFSVSFHSLHFSNCLLAIFLTFYWLCLALLV